MSNTGPKESMLAINGGSPVRSGNLPYGRQSISEDDINEVVQVLRSDWITTGPKVDEFEDSMAKLVGAKFAVAFSSGTAALHGATFAAGLDKGDQVVTTPMTFCASANCVLYTGAIPVFADVDPDTLNIGFENVKEQVNERTKALVVVDYAGHPVDLDPFLDLAEQSGLVIIEDAAHALGATYKQRRVGSISHMTTFSFHPVKHITTGEGGMVTTDNPEFARRLRMFRTHGIDQEARFRQAQVSDPWFYEMEALGFNYRLPDVACALGNSQLKRLDKNIFRRREIAGFYSTEFANVPGLILPTELPGFKSAWHLYPIRLDLSMFAVTRKEIFNALRSENLQVNVHYIPVHLHPYYRDRFNYHHGQFPVAEAAYQSLISLPLFHSMTHQDQKDVVTAVKKVLSYYAKLG